MAKTTAAAAKAADTKAAGTTTAPAAPAAPAEAMSIFDQAVKFVLGKQIEGGYVNDPRDPGGETNFGISKRAHPREDIKNLTRERAIEIYKASYWDSNRCDELPPALAVAVFDAAVNQGGSIAILLMQRALGVTADGVIGPVTLAAAAKADEEDAVIELLGWRLHRYAHTRNSSTFMRGWSNRVLRLLRFVLIDLKATT